MRSFVSSLALGCFWLTAAAAAADPPTIPQLIDTLSSSDEAARLAAIHQLGRRGPEAAEAAIPLAARLSDASPAIRAHAADALGRFGRAAEPFVDDLVRLVGDPDAGVRRKAIGALAAIRPDPQVTLPLFVKLLEEADPATRNRVMHALADAGPEAVPRLIDALQNDKAAYWACLVLCEMGPKAKAAVPALTERLRDQDHQVRREAILALGAIGPAAAPAAPQIAAALDDPIARIPAIFALGHIGQIPTGVEPKLREYAQSTDRVLGTVSLWALARTHRDDQALLRETTERLVEGLKAKDPPVRKAAARALADLQPGLAITLPALEKSLEGADEKTTVTALDALATLGPAAVPRLIEALEHEGPRPAVVYILGQIGPEAGPAVEALAELLDDKNPDVRREAVHALAKIGPAAKGAVPALVQALTAAEGPEAYGISYALGRIGPAASEAKPVLAKAVQSGDPSLALISAWALIQVCPNCPECAATAIPILIRGLGDSAPKFRAEAVNALGALGPVARQAAPALQKACQDDDPTVRQAATAALEKIGK